MGAVKVAVVGAGAFGGWTALELQRRGASVTLLDAWGPGHPRSGSGGDTRVLRVAYGPHEIYTRLALRARERWIEHEWFWNRPLFRRTGAVWFADHEDSYQQASVAQLREAGAACEEWTAAELGRRYPQINVEGIRWALFEPDAGYLWARDACARVVEALEAAGGEYRQVRAEPDGMRGGRLPSLKLEGGPALAADLFVFACGAWLAALFPGPLGKMLRVTRQEIFHFRTPAGAAQYHEDRLPIWGGRDFYGVPGNAGRGFKLADDRHGPPLDPDADPRQPTPEAERAAREYMELRFPGMRGAPLAQAQVCQYANTPDADFILDRHPEAGNVWLLGGGSGHAFKHAPAMGELAAEIILEKRPPERRFLLSRPAV